MSHKIIFELDIYHSKYNYFSEGFWEQTFLRTSYKVHCLNPCKSEFMIIPCRNTLQSYTGKYRGPVGVLSLAIQRIVMQVLEMGETEKYVSLIVDEMTI